MKNVEEVLVIHRVPGFDSGKHIHSTKCKCSPIPEIGEKGQIIICHRPFRSEFSFKKEFKEMCLS